MALTKVTKKITEKGPIFALKYDPRMPSVPQILVKHWRAIVSQNTYSKECFEKPPLTPFRRQPNIRNLLVKSKIPPPPELYPKRDLKGMIKCGKSCTACTYIFETKALKIHKNKP